MGWRRSGCEGDDTCHAHPTFQSIRRAAMLTLTPCSLSDAHSFVAQYHRHHRSSVGGLFAVSVSQSDAVVGVCVIGRPVSRMLQDGWTAEVTRLATTGERNACSMLYRAAWRACRALGYRRLVTYILATEPGVSLSAAGFKCLGQAGGGSWSRGCRPRVDKHPTQLKIRWGLTT